MFSARLTISTLTVVALLAASTARAADYSQPPPPQPIYIQQPPVIEEFSGWYLRGDIGFSNQQLGSLFTDAYSSISGLQAIDRGFDAAPLFGLGVGYNFNDWLRFDVTGEYRGRANFHGLDIATRNDTGGLIVDRYTASKYEWTFLLNGYVDLGTWYNVTPFVGAGVGFSRNTITNFGDFSTCVDTTTGCSGSDAYAGDASKWNFAWALHAGLAYRVTKNFTVELAYRYLDLGNATTDTAFTIAGTPFPPFEFRHLTSHDVKLGLRFNFEGLSELSRPVRYYSQPQIYTPPPVYAPPVYATPPPLRSRG
jgi:opacity protein-like surface antigen